jgi:hypothetical protein
MRVTRAELDGILRILISGPGRSWELGPMLMAARMPENAD